MFDTVVDQVKAELFRNKLTSGCPKCGNKKLHAVFTVIHEVDLSIDKSKLVSGAGCLLDMSCTKCGWSLDGIDNGEEEGE